MLEEYDMIKKLYDAQNILSKAQIILTALREQLEGALAEPDEAADDVRLDMMGCGCLKITVPDYPPHNNIYDRITFENQKIVNYTYVAARNRWYGLIKKALKDYHGEPITNPLVIIIYRVKASRDIDNFTVKFILDALRLFGAIFNDDLDHLNAVVQTAKVVKQNYRTEIYVSLDRNQLVELIQELDPDFSL